MEDENRIVGMPVYKCDRCGMFYEPYDGLDVGLDKDLYNSMVFTKINGRVLLSTKIIKLCPNCMMYLIAWWKEGTE